MNLGPPSMEVHDRSPSPEAKPGTRQSVPHRHVVLNGTHWLVSPPGLWVIRLAEGLEARSSASQIQVLTLTLNQWLSGWRAFGVAAL